MRHLRDKAGAGLLCILALTLVFAKAPSALAQAGAASPPPPQVQQLLQLLQDPEVRGWLDQQQQAMPKAASAEVPQQATSGGTGPVAAIEAERPAGMANRLDKVRDHLRTVAAALPRFPDEVARASVVLARELRDRGPFGILFLVAAFLALGYGSERLFWRATARTRAWIGARPIETPVDRLRMIGMRLGFGLTTVAIFALGSVGAFLIVNVPPLLREIVLTYLLAFVAVRLVLFITRIMLEPGGRGFDHPERYRVVPMSTERARFWYRRLAAFVGYFAFGWATVFLLGVLGFSPELRQASAYVLGTGLLAIGLEAVWRRPPGQESITEGAARGRNALSIVLTACGVLLWLLWVAGLVGLFWLAVAALLLPKAIRILRSSVSHLIRRTEDAAANVDRGVFEVSLERGLQALLIGVAAVGLAFAWKIDLVAMTDRDTLATRLVRGALASVVIVLLADFLWQVTKAAINRKLAETAAPAEPGTEEAVRQARLRTLLPIFRNVFMVVIAVIAALMALSALGVEIGPLIAGAGVVGVAIGFGAQTVVKDVISGIFYLLDDAFRVGEYIQSGSYKGTVESFSLRSVRLRHQRGPIFTVPFGDLGAVQNMSRDWVIDKLMIAVSYDADLEKARKLIKRIGQELADDPDHGKQVIEPMKMQGVEQFGDYGIQIRIKMTTKPGEQFVIRRKALARIRQAFDENGIQFAVPSVQVAGDESRAAPAAALQTAERMKAASQAAG